MTSDQEAVCGTCGRGENEIWPALNGVQSYGRHDCANWQDHAAIGCHPFIPAPVVPSDDAPRREQYATSDEYRAAMVEWAISAPPTPSQDAEGDGLTEAWVDLNAYCDHSGRERCEHKLAVESAIRADYEARLTTAKLAFARNEIHTIEEVFRMLESLGGRK